MTSQTLIKDMSIEMVLGAVEKKSHKVVWKADKNGGVLVRTGYEKAPKYAKYIPRGDKVELHYLNDPSADTHEFTLYHEFPTITMNLSNTAAAAENLAKQSLVDMGFVREGRLSQKVEN